MKAWTVAVLVLLGMGAWALVQVPRAEAQSGGGYQVGRFQVVNGTPERAMNIMLLDTVTGTTWQTCTSKDDPETLSWCPMQRK